MNVRQRFNATMHYQERDRIPMSDFGFWDETIPLWHQQGLPAQVTYGGGGITTDAYFGMEPCSGWTGANPDLVPAFESKVIEDRGDFEVVQQSDGVRVLRQKHMGSIPTHLAHLLVDRDSWKKHYKPRLDPSNPARFPQGAAWDNAVRNWRDKDRDNILTLPGGSLYGRLRDWMGMENLSMAVFDDPAWFEEMVTTLADCTIGVLTKLLETGGVFDNCSMWEDMAYKAGPLLGPTQVKKFLVPHLKRITSLLRKHGVDVIYLDCDGCIDLLIPIWLDAGVNCMFPVEIGTWGADPVKYRKQYGRELLMMGGFDKHILARTRRDIEKEIIRLAPLVEEGGFIPFCDHRVPPDVPYENYRFYLETARKVWGHGVNLKPIFQL